MIIFVICGTALWVLFPHAALSGLQCPWPGVPSRSSQSRGTRLTRQGVQQPCPVHSSCLLTNPSNSNNSGYIWVSNLQVCWCLFLQKAKCTILGSIQASVFSTHFSLSLETGFETAAPDSWNIYRNLQVVDRTHMIRVPDQNWNVKFLTVTLNL